MASRGRDLKVSILSDAEKFDLTRPANELEDLGDKAKQAGADLKGLDSDSDKAAKSIDNFGDKTDQTAKKVDDAFDRIAKSSRSNMRKVDDDADKAKKGLDEFKDEADSTSKEAAASFSDVESGLDAIQEIAANAFAGFGPAGKAAGIAAAVGIGFLFSGLQAASDKANETKDRIIGMAQAASEAGTLMSRSGISDTIRDWGYAIADNKSWWEVWQKDNTTNLEKVSAKAEALGLDFQDLFRGMSGSDPQAALRIMEDIDGQIAEIDATQARAASSGASVARGQITSLERQRLALRATRDEMESALGVSEEAARLYALEDAALQGTAKALQTVSDNAKETADSIGSVGDAAVESAVEQAKSIDDVIAAQDKALKAQREFASNTKEVLDEVGQEGVDWAQQFGENAPKAMQMLADAPKKKQAEIIRQYRESGKVAGSATAEGMYSQTSKVSKSAAALHSAADNELARLGSLGIKVGIKGQDVDRQAQLAWLKADAYFRRNPITIRTRYAPSGTKPIRDVP